MKTLSLLSVIVIAIFFSRQRNSEPQQAAGMLAPAEAAELTPVNAIGKKARRNELDSIQNRLHRFTGMNYDRFKPAELAEYNSLVERKAALIKQELFLKYSRYNRSYL